MKITDSKTNQRARRHGRIRSRVSGSADRPRLAVFRSNTAIYAQLIDDENGTTLMAADSRTAKGSSRLEKARAVGVALAQKAQKAGITAVVFDRGGFLYAGSVKELADGAREGGLTF